MAEASRIQRSQVTVKTVLTTSFTVLGVLALVYVLSHAQLAIALTITAAVLAVALNHAVEALTRRGMRRGLAVGLVMSGLVALVAGVLLLLIPAAVSQGKELVEEGPQLFWKVHGSDWYQWLDARLRLDERVQRLQASLPQHLESAVDPAVKVITGALTGLAGFITVLFLILFMLLFGGRLVGALLAEALPERRVRYMGVVSKVYRSIGGYLSGLAIICGVNGFFTTLFLALIQVPFFLPLGILAGLSSLVPLAGNTLAGVFLSLVALATGGLWKGIAVGSYFILYQQFENHVLGPVVYRRTVNVNPLLILVSLLFFAELAGIAGALVAIPAVAAGQIILRELLILRRERLRLPLTGPAQSPPPGEDEPPAPSDDEPLFDS